MRLRQTRRILFLGFLAQEAVIFLRATPEERAAAPVPPYPAIYGPALLAPLVLTMRVPRWLERLAFVLQLLGWTLEIAAMRQLARERSFGIHPTAATRMARGGVYRFEHPIYVGILLSLLGWTLPVPPSSIAVVITFVGFRRAVRQERAYLASLGMDHRGLESFVWPDVEQ